MFDKYKDRYKKFEEDHEAVRNVRIHIQKHQTAYASGATALVCVAATRKFSSPDMKQTLQNAPKNQGLLYKSQQIINNTVVQEMVRQGEPGKKTFWVEKGVWFPSRNAAAKAAGVSFASVKKCCEGVVESVKGQHFIDGGDMI